MAISIDWPAEGFTLDSLREKKLLRITDGDTPFVEVSIRMLSIDTPEVHYPGSAKPDKHDEKLAQLAGWIQEGKAPIKDDLAAFLHPKLATGRAGTLQLEQGVAATEAFEQLQAERLKPSRRVYVRVAQEPFDQYGRLLAYLAPSFTKTELRTLSAMERATFNLLLVQSGWAASFVIYPSLPKKSDLNLLHDVATKAHADGKGAWAEPHALTGYEFRSAYRLWDVTNSLVVENKTLGAAERSSWISRYCVDMTTRRMVAPQAYHRIPPADRLFVWPEDRVEALASLDLEFVDPA